MRTLNNFLAAVLAVLGAVILAGCGGKLEPTTDINGEGIPSIVPVSGIDTLIGDRPGQPPYMYSRTATFGFEPKGNACRLKASRTDSGFLELKIVSEPIGANIMRNRRGFAVPAGMTEFVIFEIDTFKPARGEKVVLTVTTVDKQRVLLTQEYTLLGE